MIIVFVVFIAFVIITSSSFNVLTSIAVILMFTVFIFIDINIALDIYIIITGSTISNVSIHFVDTITSIMHVAEMDETCITHTAFLICSKGVNLLARKMNHLLF